MTGAVCCQCRRWTTAPVEVRYVERPSGPGVALHACPVCAPHVTHGPTPDELLPTTQPL